MWSFEGAGRPAVCKDRGKGVMVSTWTGIHGWARVLEPGERVRVNDYRRSLGKEDLLPNENPFCMFLKIGKEYEGYWNGERMKDQVTCRAPCSSLSRARTALPVTTHMLTQQPAHLYRLTSFSTAVVFFSRESSSCWSLTRLLGISTSSTVRWL